MKELEKIIEDTKMVHKSGKEEAKLSPIQNQVENFQEETYTDYAQSFDAPEFIDEGKSLKNVSQKLNYIMRRNINIT